MSGFLVKPGQTLVCFGDSITQNAVGYCAMITMLIAASYPEAGIKVVNAGVGGNKVPDLLARLDRDVLSHQPDWVTVNVGINDVWHGLDRPGGGVDLADYRVGLETLLDRIATANVGIILLPPTVIEENSASRGNLALKAYRAAMREIGKSRGLLVAPTDIDIDAALASGAAKFGQPGKTLTTDGVHMSGPGDAVMAVAVLKTLGFFTEA